MNMSESIIVNFYNAMDVDISLTPIEPVFTDPSCGQWEPGVIAFDPRNANEYFISEDGKVYDYDDNRRCGIAPHIANDYDRRERELDNKLAQEGM